jgi:riboflavin synthase
MFTGIVEHLGVVHRVAEEPPGRILVVEALDLANAPVGSSVAINGVCLTVVEGDATRLAFQVGPETLARTNLGEIAAGDRVNLERALQAGGRLDGHFVQGHIDGVARIAQRRRQEPWEWVWFRCASALTDQMVSKGSVAVDGISLTLVDVEPDQFSVALIPHTLAITTLGFKPLGAAVNIETDILGKYVLKAIRGLGLAR